MTDKYKKTAGDEEYQFPNDEFVSGEVEKEPSIAVDEQEENSPPKFEGLLGRLSGLQNKRVWIVIGVAVLGLIGFKFMSSGHHTVVKKQAVQAVSQQETRSVALSKLDRLSQAAKNSQDTITKLQSQVSGLQSTLNTSNSDRAQMRKAVVALAVQMQNLTQQLASMNMQKKPHKSGPPSPVVTYNLVALISGRAWIMGSNGESDTVTVGTKLKHYGMVKAIDVYNGKVLTTSGKTITYNINGNQ